MTTIDDIYEKVKVTTPDYEVGCQYILWLVFDEYIPYAFDSVKAYIRLFDDQDNELTWGSYTLGKQIMRKPYMNKQIWQVGGTKGRNRTTGVFLTTPDLTMLQRIHRICVTWICEHHSGQIYVQQTNHIVSLESSDRPCWYVYHIKDWVDNLEDMILNQHLAENYEIVMRMLIHHDVVSGITNCGYNDETIAADIIKFMCETGYYLDMDHTDVLMDYGLVHHTISAEFDIFSKDANRDGHRPFLHI